MMNIRYLSAAVAACVLAACQSPTQTQTSTSVQPTQPAQPAPTVNASNQVSNPVLAKAQKFECKKGMTATVKYLGNDTISLAVDTIGAEIKLTQAVSGSGERFVNNNGFYNKTTEWHQKGNSGYFTFTDPYGNTVETSCSAK